MEKAIDGGTPSESLLGFSEEIVSNVAMPGKTQEKTLLEAMDGGSPNPELGQIIQEASLLDPETASESTYLEIAADLEGVLHPSKQDLIAKNVVSIDGGQCRHFNH